MRLWNNLTEHGKLCVGMILFLIAYIIVSTMDYQTCVEYGVGC